MTTKTNIDPLQPIIDFCAQRENRGAKSLIRQLYGERNGKPISHRTISYWLNVDAKKRTTPLYKNAILLVECGKTVMAQMKRAKKGAKYG